MAKERRSILTSHNEYHEYEIIFLNEILMNEFD
jgi:hypothetical protein